MNDKLWYLKEDAYFEPLINSWYAWPYLLPPVTGARHTVKTHMRIMKSFINNYQLHMLANKESTLAGGDFVDVPPEQVDTIRELIKKVETELSDVVDLSTAVVEFEELLRKHTSGKSIDYLYGQVPEKLRGFVEIFLDMEHNASYRLIEPLIYKSELYKPQLQSVSFGLLSRVGERPFVLSTPRIADENHLQINIDFNHPAIDQIMKARQYPITQAQMDELFGELEITGGLEYQDLFTDEPPILTHKPVTEGVRAQYIGHAGFMVETKDTAILIDPFIANRGEGYREEVVSYSELPDKIDLICLTHNHQDHVSIESLLQLRYKTNKIVVPKNNGGSLADPSMRLLLKQLQFETYEVDDLDEMTAGDMRIVAIPFLGEHGDLNIRSKAGWYVETNGKKMYFGADSSNPDEQMYAHMQDLLGEVDLFAIGMECVGAPYTWLYGALHSKMVPKAIKDSRRLNGSDFVQANKMIELLKPKQTYIYALGQEPWYKYFMGIDYDDDSEQIVESNKLIAACEEQNIPAKSLFGRETVEV